MRGLYLFDRWKEDKNRFTESCFLPKMPTSSLLYMCTSAFSRSGEQKHIFFPSLHPANSRKKMGRFHHPMIASTINSYCNFSFALSQLFSPQSLPNSKTFLGLLKKYMRESDAVQLVQMQTIIYKGIPFPLVFLPPFISSKKRIGSLIKNYQKKIILTFHKNFLLTSPLLVWNLFPFLALMLVFTHLKNSFSNMNDHIDEGIERNKVQEINWLYR
jgi:hypothetical protein